MKVLYEPGEITSIKKSVEMFKDNGCGCLFEENNPDRLYGLTHLKIIMTTQTLFVNMKILIRNLNMIQKEGVLDGQHHLLRIK